LDTEKSTCTNKRDSSDFVEREKGKRGEKVVGPGFLGEVEKRKRKIALVCAKKGKSRRSNRGRKKRSQQQHGGDRKGSGSDRRGKIEMLRIPRKEKKEGVWGGGEKKPFPTKKEKIFPLTSKRKREAKYTFFSGKWGGVPRVDFPKGGGAAC